MGALSARAPRSNANNCFAHPRCVGAGGTAGIGRASRGGDIVWASRESVRAFSLPNWTRDSERGRIVVVDIA